MGKVKITVLKVSFFEDLAQHYLKEGAEPCPYHREGQTYIYEGGAERPENLCPWAWIDLYRACSTLDAGGFDNGWYARGDLRVQSCADGVRPVSFLLEAMRAE